MVSSPGITDSYSGDTCNMQQGNFVRNLVKRPNIEQPFPVSSLQLLRVFRSCDERWYGAMMQVF